MTTPVDHLSWVGTAGPLVVELVGAPGAGKTSVLPGVHAALRASGWESFSPEEGARLVVARMPIGRLIARLPSERLRRGLLWRAYAAHRLIGAGRTVMRRPGGFFRLVREQRRRPAGALARRRRVVYWFVRTMGAQEFFRRHAADGQAVVFDEGYVHRVVQLFSSPVGGAPPEAVARYLDSVPRPDLVIAVECPPEVCLDRIRARGVWDRLTDLEPDGLAAFVANSAEVVEHAIGHTLAAGWRVVELDNGDVPFERLTETARYLVHPSVPGAGEAGTERHRALYRIRFPRPGRIVRTLKGRRGPDPIAAETVKATLARIGLVPTGRAGVLPLGRRSDSIWVDTDAGRMVVRSYAPHWLDESIDHEHAVLRYLAEVDYPATRLMAAADGTTLHDVDGRRLAVYGFFAGANLSGSYVTARAGLEAMHMAGRLLARLHSVTDGLDLGHSHHLEMDGTDGESRIDHQLLLLDELTSAPGNHRDAEWMREQAPALAKRLTEVHGQLMDAGAEICLIHGDYGLHNILVRRDGSAIVHDFELARRDWRMVDIVEVLDKVRVPVGRALLAGYRFEAGGELAEWLHLAAMWEYHRLGGALRSWESFVRRGDFERLAVARRRLEAAGRIAAEGVSRWL